jgi:hypothetical protein
MGSRGDCFDNAVAESFFATLKKELIRRRSWPTREELRTAVFDYIAPPGSYSSRATKALPTRSSPVKPIAALICEPIRRTTGSTSRVNVSVLTRLA